MADLYNLDDEINNTLNNESEAAAEKEKKQDDAVSTQNDDQQQSIEERSQEWETTNNDGAVVDVLQHQQQQQQQNDDENNADNSNATNKINIEKSSEKQQRIDLEDLFTKTTNQNESSSTYKQLYKAWSQELLCPELLPFPTEIYERIVNEIENADNDTDNGDDTENLLAIFNSIRNIDLERCKFIISDFCKLRLYKIQKFPMHFMRNNRFLSVHEKTFLQEYGMAMEEHFKHTVTNHFPKDMWKKLDEPDMIDTPNVDEYVFLQCIEDIAVRNQDGDDDGTMLTRKAGEMLIFRYNRIRKHLFDDDDATNASIQNSAIRLI